MRIAILKVLYDVGPLRLMCTLLLMPLSELSGSREFYSPKSLDLPLFINSSSGHIAPSMTQGRSAATAAQWFPGLHRNDSPLCNT